MVPSENKWSCITATEKEKEDKDGKGEERDDEDTDKEAKEDLEDPKALNEDGCKKYTRKLDPEDKENTTCISDRCNQRQKLLGDGTCQFCPAYTRASNSVGQKLCASDKCSDNSRVLPDGTCQECEPFTKVMDNGRSCRADPCTSR